MSRTVKALWARLNSGTPYFIAEAGVNHLGNMELAERLIKEAAEAGADAIKFQSYTASKLCTKHAERFWDWEGELEDDGNQLDSYGHLDSFGAKEHQHLADLCAEYNIEFMSTPFDNDAVDYLDAIGVRAYKVASCDITNYDLLAHIASKGKIVMLSTGAADIAEISGAMTKLYRNGCKHIVVMHCNLRYPTPDDEINLGMLDNIRGMVDATGYDAVLGLSDHTMTMLTPAIAYALGARVFERHYTVDKTLGKSADHWLSADPAELKVLIKNTRKAQELIGSSIKECTPGEKRAKKLARRSIATIAPIKRGEPFTRENIACKRPGTGLQASWYGTVLGSYAQRDIDPDELVMPDDIDIPWLKPRIALDEDSQ